jgi:hypothetical protein
MASNWTDTNWIVVGASLIGGGAFGAIITLISGAVRNRKQVIAYRTELVPLFRGGMLGGSDVKGKLTLSSSTGGYAEDIPNLFVADVEIVNRGNRDFASFKIGFTLSDGDLAVHCAISAADRHHQAKISTQLGPATPAKAIDFDLAPFNRQDLYKFTLYIVVPDAAEQPGEIQLSSPEPVIFNKAPTTTERLLAAASKVTVDLGPLKLSIH